MSTPDFDKFLSDLTNESARKDEIEQELNAINLRIEADLATYHTDRVVSLDPIRQEELRMQLFDATYRYLTEHLAAADDTSPSDDEIKIAAAYETADRILREHARLARVTIALMGNVLRQRDGTSSAEKDTAIKKQLMAELIIVDELELDDTFLTFVDHIVPGEALDLSSDADVLYLTNATEKYVHSHELEIRTKQFAAEAKDVLQAYGYKTEKQVLTVMEIFDTYSHHVMLHGSQADFEAALDRIARESRLPSEAITEIIALLSTHFPANGT